jgi:hypothetical protein
MSNWWQWIALWTSVIYETCYPATVPPSVYPSKIGRSSVLFGGHYKYCEKRSLTLKGRTWYWGKYLDPTNRKHHTYEELRKLSPQNITKIVVSKIMGQAKQSINLGEEDIEVLMGNLYISYLEDRILDHKITLRSVK